MPPPPPNCLPATLLVFLKSIPPLARGNLPRVWDASGGPSDGGLVEPVRPEVSSEHPTLIGGVMDERLVDDSAQLLRARLEQDIVRPIDQWLEALYIVKVSDIDQPNLNSFYYN